MLDTITWGNPSLNDKKFLDTPSPFDKHIPKLKDFTFPKNSSKTTREELNQLVDYVNALKNDEAYMKRYVSYDVSFERVMAQVIIEQGLDENSVGVIDALLDESIPFLYKLKYHFQRPRPYQLAHYYKLNLFPFKSNSSQSPSFPSGHTLQAALICYVLGNHYPDKYDYFDRLAKDIELSRLYMGLHYPSDNDFSLYCVEMIVKDKDFKQQYSL